MRIGIDVRLQNESGVGRYIRNLVKYLKQIDKKNVYILLDPDVRWHTFKEQIMMPYILLKKKLDLVHFPYFNVPILYPGKFVVTIHDLTIGHFDTGRASTLNPLLYKIKRLGYRFVMSNAIKRAEKVMVPTNTVRKDILQNYNIASEKIVVIYEGVDKDLKDQSAKLKNTGKLRKQLQPKHYFLYVGNAYPHKNLELLILGFRQILTKKTISLNLSKDPIRLVLVGKKDYFYKRLKNKARDLGLKDEIVFTGFLGDNELSWLYQNAIALVLPSFREGFGLPALEAIQNGCLVLASDIPALREVCEDAAVYFNPKSIENIVHSMKEIIQYPDRYRDKVEQGKKRTAQFSWEKTAQETLKIYGSCASL